MLSAEPVSAPCSARIVFTNKLEYQIRLLVLGSPCAENQVEVCVCSFNVRSRINAGAGERNGSLHMCGGCFIFYGISQWSCELEHSKCLNSPRTLRCLG